MFSFFIYKYFHIRIFHSLSNISLGEISFSNVWHVWFKRNQVSMCVVEDRKRIFPWILFPSPLFSKSICVTMTPCIPALSQALVLLKKKLLMMCTKHVREDFVQRETTVCNWYRDIRNGILQWGTEHKWVLSDPKNKW